FSIFVTFPTEYHAENLAGKEAEFKIKLHEIKAKELPELDDEFVKDVSDKETVEDYKKEIKETLTKRLKDEKEAQINNDLSEKLIELIQGEIPTQMYDNEVNTMIREFDMRLRSQGLDAMSYLKYTGMDVEGLAGMYRPDAEKRVKLRLALEKIAKLENIEITEADLEAEYAKIAEAYNMTAEQIKPMFTDDVLKADLAVQKAMDLVRKEAVTK
ncbi:MAG: trigger factor, partial [Clostridia bacterium]|nr:trigger factor [Clostridia bacterium]